MPPFLFGKLPTILTSLPLAISEGSLPAALLPTPLGQYRDPAGAGLWEVLAHRAEADPFNLVALAIFACAILHTFLTAKIRRWPRRIRCSLSPSAA